jgi:hypothetical protein
MNRSTSAVDGSRRRGGRSGISRGGGWHAEVQGRQQHCAWAVAGQRLDPAGETGPRAGFGDQLVGVELVLRADDSDGAAGLEARKKQPGRQLGFAKRDL